MGSVVTDVSREAKDKQRRERARQQLLKLNKKKREDKIATLLKELNQHLELQRQREAFDLEEYLLMLEEAGHDSEEVWHSLEVVLANINVGVVFVQCHPSAGEAVGGGAGEVSCTGQELGHRQQSAAAAATGSGRV